MGSTPSHDNDSDNIYSGVEDDDLDGYERDDFYYSDNDMSVEEEETNSVSDIENPYESVICEVIPTNVADLKEMASLTVAIALYKHVDIPAAISAAISRGGNVSHHLESSIYLSVLQSTKDLPTPKSVVKHINTYVDKMRKQIKDWVPYNYRKVFFLNRTDHFGYNHIQHLVWYSNGTINSKETARSLLNSIRLTELEKYYLLCTYCLKDDFERLSPLFRTHYVVDKLEFRDYPLICYWNRFFKKQLNKIPAIGTGSFDAFMIQRSKVDNWPAKEYFFDRLSSDEQIRMVIWLIDKHGSRYIKLVLMKLNEPQRLHVYMDRAVKIMTIYINTKSSFEEILSTWYEIRNLINKTQFVTVFGLLLIVEYDDAVLEAIWSSSCAEYKDYFLNGSDQFESIERTLLLWTSNYKKDFFFTIMRDANESLKTNMTEKRFFKLACEKLICANELMLLDRLLKSCFTDTQSIAKYKECLTQQDYFTDLYLSLVLVNESAKLEQLLNSFFPDAGELSRFKRDVIKKACFLQRLKSLVSNCEFPYVEQLLNLFPAGSEEVLKFKISFVEDAFFMILCERFVIDDKLAMLEQIFEMFFVQRQDIVKFKQELSARETVRQHCENLVYGNEDRTLQDLLNCLFTNAEELVKFKRDLAVNSHAMKSRCSGFYSKGNLQSINILLNRFLSPYPGLITEYKKNLVMSSMFTSVDFFEQSPEIFCKMVTEGFLPIDAVTEMKKTIIFSTSAVERMKTMIQEGRLDRVKERFNQFLTSNEDKKTLKTVVIGRSEDIIQMIPTFFYRHSPSMWQSLMIWWLGNENLVREFKQTLPVDDLFDMMLNNCVFDQYDGKFLRYCRFKANLSFVRLDRFLLWILETVRNVKEYKMKRIDSYMNIDTIRTLLKKKDDSYIKTVIQWFFEGDQQEVTKFKNKNRGRKITKIM